MNQYNQSSRWVPCTLGEQLTTQQREELAGSSQYSATFRDGRGWQNIPSSVDPRDRLGWPHTESLMHTGRLYSKR